MFLCIDYFYTYTECIHCGVEKNKGVLTKKNPKKNPFLLLKMEEKNCLSPGLVGCFGIIILCKRYSCENETIHITHTHTLTIYYLARWFPIERRWKQINLVPIVVNAPHSKKPFFIFLNEFCYWDINTYIYYIRSRLSNKNKNKKK